MLETCIASCNHCIHTVNGKGMFHFKDVYSIYFNTCGMKAFINNVSYSVRSDC